MTRDAKQSSRSTRQRAEQNSEKTKQTKRERERERQRDRERQRKRKREREREEGKSNAIGVQWTAIGDNNHLSKMKKRVMKIKSFQYCNSNNTTTSVTAASVIPLLLLGRIASPHRIHIWSNTCAPVPMYVLKLELRTVRNVT